MFMYLFITLTAVTVVLTGSGCAYNSAISRNMKKVVMPGAGPIFLEGSSSKAALLLHGFIGTPRDFAEFPEALNRAGYTVSVPLLPGHGTHPGDFSRTTPEELEAFALAQYRELKKKYERVDVVGLSMGGSLAILLASQEKVDRLVLVAPYLKIAHQWYYLLPTEFYQAVFSNFIPYVHKPLTFKQVNKKESAPKILDYSYVSLRGAGTAISLGRKAIQAAGSIHCHTLILHSKGDKATDYRESVRLARALDRTSGAKLITLTKSNHMIFWDYDAEWAEKEILAYLKS